MGVLVIAELGSCHDGSLRNMLRGAEMAARCGADCLKLQWTSDPVAMAKRRGKALEDGYAQIYEQYLAWEEDIHEAVSRRCHQLGIGYMCTVYLEQDIRIIAPHVSRFKIASFEAGDTGFVAAHLRFGKPVHISMGMLSWAGCVNVKALVDACNIHDVDVLPMHCVSSYPAPLEELNLSVLSDDFWDGFSDHSQPDWYGGYCITGALAVTAGAKTIEAHIKLPDTDMDNPDEAHAMSGMQFSTYVRHIRIAERAVGDSLKKIQPCESSMSKYRVGQ